MKLLLLYGSPHPLGSDGHTARLTEAFLKGFGCEPSELFIFDAFAAAPEPCSDCGACAESNICARRDLDGLDGALHSADAIVIASPVYHSSVPAPLKAVFDRTQRYFLAFRRGERVFEKNTRPACLLLTAGQKKENGEVIKTQLHWILPTLEAVLYDTVVANGLNSGGITDELLSRAYDSGKDFRALLR